MLIGVPKEIKKFESRVGLTPTSVGELTARGHCVVVETGAGLGIDASDEAYRAAGAKIAMAAQEIFELADLIIKVKEPQKSEWSLLRANQILFTYLHLAADREQARGLMMSGCTAIAYETVTDEQNGLPLLAPMSEVAGRLAVIEGAACLKTNSGGRGLLISGVPGTQSAEVVIIGGGVVGVNAAKMAVGLGANVTLFDRSVPRLRYLADIFGDRISTRFSNRANLEEASRKADMVIGAALIPGGRTPRLISRAFLSEMKKGSVLIDVAIDQGGCFETSMPTTHQNPTYTVDNVLHYCVTNMPGAVPLTSSEALNNVTLPYILSLAEQGLSALDTNKNFKNGLNIHNGKIVHNAVKNAIGPIPRL